MTALWFGLLMAGTAAAQTTAGADQTGGISGVVTDAISKVPVKKAAVTLNSIGNPGVRNQGQPSTVTDASGAFTFSNLQAGPATLTVQHPNYPQARSGAVVKSVNIKPGETTGPVAVELIPGGAVSGHVTDEDGDPMPNCVVQPHPAANPQMGVPVSGNGNSNEDGEFRIYSIPPGKYILTARCVRQAFQARPFSSGPDAPPTHAYSLQFYPLSSEEKGAQVVELTPGTEKSGVDFRMRPTPVTQVHGAFSPSGADWHGTGPMNIQLISLDQKWRLGMGVGAQIDQAKGTFDFRQVFPGSYILVAAFNGGSEDGRIGATQRIDVSDQPVALVLELRHAMELTGKVEIEAGGNTTNPPISPIQLGIQLIPQYQIGLPIAQTQVGDDGSFTLKGVIPAPWRLQVNASSAFVKSAWLGSTEVTNAPMDLSSGASGTLRVVVSTNMATIRGSAPAGQTIFVQRIEEDMPFRSTRGTQADPTGQYKLPGLAPGKYRLVMVDTGSPLPDEGGQEVTVHEGETIMLDLKAPATP